MKTLDSDLIETYLGGTMHYTSITYEISRHRKGGIVYEYTVYERDGEGESYTTKFSNADDLEKWLIENTERVDI